jgi:hypothetical protein
MFLYNISTYFYLLVFFVYSLLPVRRVVKKAWKVTPLLPESLRPCCRKFTPLLPEILRRCCRKVYFDVLESLRRCCLKVYTAVAGKFSPLFPKSLRRLCRKVYAAVGGRFATSNYCTLGVRLGRKTLFSELNAAGAGLFLTQQELLTNYI